MRINIWSILVLTVMLVGLVAMVGTLEVPTEESVIPDLHVSVEVNGRQEKVNLWEDQTGCFFIFLPSYAEMDQVFLISEIGPVSIDGIPIEGKHSADHYELYKKYPVCFVKNGAEREALLIFLQSGNIPAIHIDVASSNMRYINSDKTNEEMALMRLYDVDGNALYSGELSSIKGRGNTSWDAEKKPYNLTLAEEADLLGMGAAQKWVLLAEGYNLINIRNKIVYDFADVAGMCFAPECEWVDLYLNGEYAGLYLLSERNEVHPERINVPEEKCTLVSQEYESRLQEQKLPYILTRTGQAMRVRMGKMRIEEIQKIWQSAENAILSSDGVDPVTGMHWSALIDLDSWAQKYLLEELFGNLDAGSLSQYYYIIDGEEHGKIYAGPVWDYDFSMGGEFSWMRPYTDYFVMNRMWVNDNIYTPWYPALCQQNLFINHVKQLYEEKFLPAMVELLNTKLSGYASLIQRSIECDSVRWGISGEEVANEWLYISSFLENRTMFLSDLLLEENVYHTVTVDTGRSGIYGCFAVKDGQTLPELPGEDSLGGLGWYENDIPFDITKPIHNDTFIYMRKPDISLPVIHYVPVVVITLGLLAGLLTDKYRKKRNGSFRDDAA